MKNILKGINGRICEAEEWISEWEDRVLEITAAEQNKENRMKRSEDSLRDNWVKYTNIHNIDAPEVE